MATAAANSAESTPRKVVGRPFQPGQSGNPSGRPKKIAELSQAVREQLDPGDLAALWLSVATDPEQKMTDRLEASRLLADRGWGKAADFKPQEDDPLGLTDAREKLVGKLAPVASLDDHRAESGGQG